MYRYILLEVKIASQCSVVKSKVLCDLGRFVWRRNLLMPTM
jgi:hypothetical protein